MALELRPNCECCDIDLARMHVLRRLRGKRFAQCLSELRWRLRAAADPPGYGMAARTFGRQAPAIGQAPVIELQPRRHGRPQPTHQGHCAGAAMSIEARMPGYAIVKFDARYYWAFHN